MDSSLWSLLHDGSIESIAGAVPGDVALQVSIRYLRDRFPGDGTGFVVRLLNCTHLSFEPYDGPSISDFPAIVALEPEILSAESNDMLEVACVTGTLHLRYDAVKIFLDAGGEVALSELDSACRAYWDDWSARAKVVP